MPDFLGSIKNNQGLKQYNYPTEMWGQLSRTTWPEISEEGTGHRF